MKELFEDWFSDNKRELEKDFCEDNYDKFMQYVHEAFNNWYIDRR